MMPASSSHPKQAIIVLYVDDEPSLADTAAAFLEREADRINVETVLSDSDGLARLADDTSDCVIPDYDMYNMSGIDFLKVLSSLVPPQLAFDR